MKYPAEDSMKLDYVEQEFAVALDIMADLHAVAPAGTSERITAQNFLLRHGRKLKDIPS